VMIVRDDSAVAGHRRRLPSACVFVIVPEQVSRRESP
jgi:hypothetical protein